MEEAPILQVNGLTKAYGGVLAVSGVDFSVEKGQVMGIIGPNGSGKTTLVNLITGFARPDYGKVLFKARDITGLKPHVIANLGIARTFQVMRPFHSMPAYKNLIIALNSSRAKGFNGGTAGDRDQVAIDLLEEVGFERDARVPYKMAGSLPLGYQKRLELARCMAMRAEIIICDEVFSGLSMSEIASLIPLLERLNREGITLIMIEHRLRELFRLAQRILVMSFGSKIAEGTPEEVMAMDVVQKAYWGGREKK